MRLRYRRRTILAPGGYDWREVPLTDYEANLLRRVAAEPANADNWRGTLLGGIVQRFDGSGRFGVKI